MSVKILNIPEMGFASNCYIVFSEESRKAAIIDPGSELATIVKVLEDNELDLEKIILTHGHSDHITSAQELRDKYELPILIHPADEEMINSSELNFSNQMSAKRIEFSSDQHIDEGDKIGINNGEFAFEVFHTPGHTPGGICLKFENFMITGDTIFQSSIGRTDFPGGDYQAIIDSIKTKIISQPIQTILLPGHGGSTTVEDEINYNPFLR